MNIKEYLENLNENSQQIFQKMMEDPRKLGKVHHISSFIFEFSECLFDADEKKMLKTVSSQLETATLTLSMGMYRQAFSSLRLAFELGLGTVYFSINKLDHNEWIAGKNDIKWSKLIDIENGILSIRFCKAFFSELSGDIQSYNARAKKVYREMSEYVHGNNETWEKSGLVLRHDEDLSNKYFNMFDEVSQILLYVLCCRYLKSFSAESLDIVSTFILEEMQDIATIREFVGGPKEKV